MASLRRVASAIGRPFGYALFRSESDRTILLLGDPMQESFAHVNRALRDLQAEVERLSREVESLAKRLGE